MELGIFWNEFIFDKIIIIFNKPYHIRQIFYNYNILFQYLTGIGSSNRL